MALTFTKARCELDTALAGAQAGQFIWEGTIDFDSSYPTGGEAVAATDFHADAAAITSMQLTVEAGDSVPLWDEANSKIILFTEALAQETGSSDQSGVSLHARVTLTR